MWSMMQLLSFAVTLKKQPWRIPVNEWGVTVFQPNFLYGQLKCGFHICFMSNKICFFAFFQPFEKAKEILSLWAVHKSNLAHRLWLANPSLLSQPKKRGTETGWSHFAWRVSMYSRALCPFIWSNVYWGLTVCSGLFWVLGFQKWTRQRACPM